MNRSKWFGLIQKRMSEPRRFIQILASPRQTGKTTLARQLMAEATLPTHYASADEPTLRDRTWIEQHWDVARLEGRDRAFGAVLVLDEIQKVTGWSEIVKFLCDGDTHPGVPLKVLLLGSSPLLIHRGFSP